MALSHADPTIEVAHFFPADEKTIPLDEQGVVIVWLKSCRPNHLALFKAFVHQLSRRNVKKSTKVAIRENAVLKVKPHQRQSYPTRRAGDAD